MRNNVKIELLKLCDLPMEEIVEMTEKETNENFPAEVEFCNLISAKIAKTQKALVGKFNTNCG